MCDLERVGWLDFVDSQLINSKKWPLSLQPKGSWRKGGPGSFFHDLFKLVFTRDSTITMFSIALEPRVFFGSFSGRVKNCWQETRGGCWRHCRFPFSPQKKRAVELSFAKGLDHGSVAQAPARKPRSFEFPPTKKVEDSQMDGGVVVWWSTVETYELYGYWFSN